MKIMNFQWFFGNLHMKMVCNGLFIVNKIIDYVFNKFKFYKIKNNNFRMV